MSDPPLSDIDFKNKMAWVWTTLKIIGKYMAKIWILVFQSLGFTRFQHSSDIIVRHNHRNFGLVLSNWICSIFWYCVRFWSESYQSSKTSSRYSHVQVNFQLVKWGTSSQWSFHPNSALRPHATTTGKTHPSLVSFLESTLISGFSGRWNSLIDFKDILWLS